MTRKEAKEQYGGMPIAFQIIDTIYDNFELNSCDNCALKHVGTYDVCDIVEPLTGQWLSYDSSTFSCNNHQRITNETN